MSHRYKRKESPIKAHLLPESDLRNSVCNGTDAMKGQDRKYLSPDVSESIADSLDIDECFKEKFPNAHRWDYLLGRGSNGRVVGLEPHSAKHDAIKTIIEKKKDAQQQLVNHLRPGKRILQWLWVSSGKVHFANTEKTRRCLDQNGITFVGRQVLPKHLLE